MSRGELRIYLGAAPGVGKTVAMLDEGFRRRERGTDVVIGYVETHGRPSTATQLRDLETVARRRYDYRGASFEEMDLEAVLARRPHVVLVDELAHTNAPGSLHEKRWQDVEALLDAGINVVSTVNIQHLESVNDVVERITGVAQRETVPDVVVRQAGQVELVDMTPEALRRRMAHGNIYPAEKVDAALSNYFRPGNLAALRELALLWVADRVDDSLQDYLRDHGIAETWETRERIVVAVTGVAATAELIRRAARIAARARADLVAVHVASASGLSDSPADLDHQRALVRDLGGSYHELIDDDPARALVAFARSERATQLVLGATGRTRWQRATQGSVIDTVVRQAEGFDVHVIATGAAPRGAAPKVRRRPPALSARRRLAGLVVGGLGLVVVTVGLALVRDRVELSSVFLAYLVVTVAATVIGGTLPGLVVAVSAFLLENFYFIEPIHTFTVTEPENVASLLGFLAFSVAASTAAQRIARRGREAERARAEAGALARTAGALAADADTLPLLVDNLRTTLEIDAVSLLGREGDHWNVIASAGAPVPTSPEDGERFTVDADTVLVLAGQVLDVELRQLMAAFSGQAAAVLETRRLRRETAKLDGLAQADAMRVGLLRSVSHDLRTPLAGIKASVTSLLGDEVDWSADQQQEFLTTIDEECDRLNRLVTNLLDASRLQAGAIVTRVVPVALDDVVAAALASLPRCSHPLDIDLDGGLPQVDCDPVLLERVIANVVSNALRYSPADRPIRLTGGTVGDRVELLIMDRGPGIAAANRTAALRPFQRLGDHDVALGVGLGLAVAHGFTELLGGELRLDDTPGGGLTVTLSLPRSATP